MNLKEYLSEKPTNVLTRPALTTPISKGTKKSGISHVIHDKGIEREIFKITKGKEYTGLMDELDPSLKDKILKVIPLKKWEFFRNEYIISITFPSLVGKGERVKLKDTGETLVSDINYTLNYNKTDDKMVLEKKENKIITFKEFLDEARPVLIPFRLRKTNHYWTLKNLKDDRLIMLQQFNIKRLRMFLKDVNAYDNIKPLSSGFNFDTIKRELLSKGEITIYIPANRIQYMKSVYSGNGSSPYGNTKKYSFKDTEYDIDDYEKSYKY